MGTIFGREPAAIAAFIGAIIALLTSFGLHLTAEQIGSIMAVVTLLLGLIVRSVVTPTTAPKLDPGTAVISTKNPESVTVVR